MLPSDKDMLDYLEQESLDLRCHDAPIGGGDADVMWRVIAHYMAAPKERQIGRTSANPREAIASAMNKESDDDECPDCGAFDCETNH